MRPQKVDRVRVDREAAVLFALGCLLAQFASEGTVDGDLSSFEVDIGPAQSAQLAAAASGDHDDPQESSPRWRLPGFVEYRGCSNHGLDREVELHDR